MSSRLRSRRRSDSGASTPPRQYRWLILVHVLPPTPSNLRVRTWRRLQQLGALAVKQSVYLLPDSPSAREDFEWLKTEITGAGGEATVFGADNVDSWSDEALVEEFRRSRQAGYAELARDIEKALKAVATKKGVPKKASRSARQPRPRAVADSLRERLADLQRIDFFGSSGRERAEALLAQLEERATPTAAAKQAPAAGRVDPSVYRKRLWVTRPRPGVDRMASAWLIRRFIDPDASFGFVTDPAAVPEGAVAFDMFDGDFTHQGDRCTFETLCERFDVRDAGVAHLAATVHDLDMKDGKFGSPEASTVGEIIDGMQLACDGDESLLAQGIALFEALYQAASRSKRRPLTC